MCLQSSFYSHTMLMYESPPKTITMAPTGWQFG
jgi:hypothetical protein